MSPLRHSSSPVKPPETDRDIRDIRGWLWPGRGRWVTHEGRSSTQETYPSWGRQGLFGSKYPRRIYLYSFRGVRSVRTGLPNSLLQRKEETVIFLM